MSRMSAGGTCTCAAVCGSGVTVVGEQERSGSEQGGCGDGCDGMEGVSVAVGRVERAVG